MDDKETIVKFLEEMSTQDNRATAFPIFYVIRSADWVPVSNDYPFGDGGDEGNSYRVEYVNKECGEDILTQEEYDALPDGLAQAEYEEVTRGRIWREHGMFLTETDAKRHLELNEYHYSRDAHTYVKCASRAPELKGFLLALFHYFGVAPRKDPGTM